MKHRTQRPVLKCLPFKRGVSFSFSLRVRQVSNESPQVIEEVFRGDSKTSDSAISFNKVREFFALGLVVNFFPTFGFGVFISGFFARLFGGHAFAGFLGGSTLTFFWPLLFYFNMRVGSWAQSKGTLVEDPAALTEQTIKALAWRSTFTIGAFLNSLLVGLIVYFLLRLLYERTRPAALAYFRRHVQAHQRRFSFQQQPTRH